MNIGKSVKGKQLRPNVVFWFVFYGVPNPKRHFINVSIRNVVDDSINEELWK